MQSLDVKYIFLVFDNNDISNIILDVDKLCGTHFVSSDTICHNDNNCNSSRSTYQVNIFLKELNK